MTPQQRQQAKLKRRAHRASKSEKNSPPPKSGAPHQSIPSDQMCLNWERILNGINREEGYGLTKEEILTILDKERYPEGEVLYPAKEARAFRQFAVKTIERYLRIKRLKELDLSPILDEKGNLVRELVAIGRKRVISDWENKVEREDLSSFLHPDVEDRVKEIGERIWELTKNDDPDYMHWIFRCEMLSFGRLDQRELSMAWDGIGNWRD